MEGHPKLAKSTTIKLHSVHICRCTLLYAFVCDHAQLQTNNKHPEAIIYTTPLDTYSRYHRHACIVVYPRYKAQIVLYEEQAARGNGRK